jgi:hypothetical protein
MHAEKSMATLSERGLAIQGFSGPTVRRPRAGLRFTPSMSTLWIGLGTALASPAVLLGFSLVSAFAASQRKHPFDRLYGQIARAAKRKPLPENPPPRRFAMALAAAWAGSSAILMATGHRSAGVVAGALLTAAGLTVATTHFCLGSWLYRQAERLRASR